MSKFGISLNNLKGLLSIARQAGTVDRWIKMAIDWCEQADAHIEKLEAERKPESGQPAAVQSIEHAATYGIGINRGSEAIHPSDFYAKQEQLAAGQSEPVICPLCKGKGGHQYSSCGDGCCVVSERCENCKGTGKMGLIGYIYADDLRQLQADGMAQIYEKPQQFTLIKKQDEIALYTHPIPAAPAAPDGAWCCIYKEKCKWQAFALHRGLGWGEIPPPTNAWREWHDKECGGALLQLLAASPEQQGGC